MHQCISGPHTELMTNYFEFVKHKLPSSIQACFYSEVLIKYHFISLIFAQLNKEISSRKERNTK